MLNSKQKTAIAIGALLAIIAGLFPRYEGRLYLPKTPEFAADLGHYFILAPPDQNHTKRIVVEQTDMLYEDSAPPTSFRVEPVLETVYLLWGTIVIAVIGAILLLSKNRQK